MDTKKSFLDKFSNTEVVQWGIIFNLLIFLCILAGFKFKNSSEVINLISFASSASSIFLALVAIVFAFYQNNASSEQNRISHETLSKINDKVDELVNLKGNVATMQEDLALVSSVINSMKDISLSKTIESNKNIPKEIVDKVKEEEVKLKESVAKLENNFNEIAGRVNVIYKAYYRTSSDQLKLVIKLRIHDDSIDPTKFIENILGEKLIEPRFNTSVGKIRTFGYFVDRDYDTSILFSELPNRIAKQFGTSVEVISCHFE